MVGLGAAHFDGVAVLEPVEGGAARQDSVRLGLTSLKEAAPDRVLIHDGARPFVDRLVTDRVLDALEAAPAAVPALAVKRALSYFARMWTQITK